MPDDINELEFVPMKILSTEEMFHFIAMDTPKLSVVLDDAYPHLVPGRIKLIGDIEQFVERIVNLKSPGFKLAEDPKTKKTIWVSTELGEYFALTQTFYFYKFPSHIELSENIQLFLLAADDIGYFHVRGQVDHRRSLPDLYHIQLFNFLIARIREKSDQRAYRQAKQKRYYAAKKNYLGAVDYVECLFKQFRQLHLVRLECAIPSKDQEDYGANFAHDYLDAFLNNRRSNKMFSDLVGYIWKLEFSETHGHYFHFLLFFRAFSITDDVEFTERIGMYWRSAITKGLGSYQNCFSSFNKYRSSSSGYISAIGHEKREDLRLAIYYLTMKDNYLRFRFKKNIRIFGRGKLRRVLICTEN